YRSVPVYADVTQQQLSVVYVPIGRGLMRVYEVNPRSIVTLPVPPPEPAPDADAAVPRLVSNPAPADIPRPTRMESVRRPDARNGVWLEFDGARYYSDGPAAPFDAARFTQVGDYRGFAVYRASSGQPDEIWVAVAMGESPVAPYKR